MKLLKKNNVEYNNEKKNEGDWTSAKKQSVLSSTSRKGKRTVKEAEENHVNPFLKKTSIRCVLPLTKKNG